MVQIFDPEGLPLLSREDAVMGEEQRLLIGEVDLDKCRMAKSALDPTGHYGRPDVFQLSFDDRARNHVSTIDDGAGKTDKSYISNIRKHRRSVFRGNGDHDLQETRSLG